MQPVCKKSHSKTADKHHHPEPRHRQAEHKKIINPQFFSAQVDADATRMLTASSDGRTHLKLGPIVQGAALQLEKNIDFLIFTVDELPMQQKGRRKRTDFYIWCW